MMTAKLMDALIKTGNIAPKPAGLDAHAYRSALRREAKAFLRSLYGEWHRSEQQAIY